VAYKDPDYMEEIGTYEVLVNPEKTSKKASINYSSSSSTIGSSVKTVKFRGDGEEKYEFNFFFDGTGIITSKNVADQIDELKKLVYHYNGDIHESNYIKILWGLQSEFREIWKCYEQIKFCMDTD